MTKSKNGGQLLVECLIKLGARKSFGVPGESYLPVLDALHDTKGALDFICCRNEGGAAFMSVAYGKLTATPGICFVTRGPGATNASIGVHTAMQDSTPMLLFVGQVGTAMKHREAFQEVNYEAYFGSVAKWVVEIPHVDRIPELVSRAWSTALSGRGGPVVVALPEEVLSDLTTVKPCLPISIPEPAVCPMGLETARGLIEKSKKLLLLVGGRGWKEAGKHSLLTFAKQANLPIVVAFRFHDVIDNTHECYVGDAGVGMSPYLKTLIKGADLIIAIGNRFGEMTTDGYELIDIPNPQMKLIHAHSSDSELGKIVAADVPLHCGPNQMARALASLDITPKNEQWRDKARTNYLQGLEPIAQPGAVDMGQIMQYLQRVLPEDAVLTNGAGNFAIWLNKFFQFGERHRLLAPQSGAMGFGLPAAIASKVVDKNRTVVCIAGDGDFQMNCQELGTAMQYDIQPIILIVNNGSYGTIRMHQERHFPARVSSTEILNPDFVQIAQAYGFTGEVVKRTEEFYPAFEKALASQTGAIIDIQIDIESLTPRLSLSEIRAQSQV